MPSLPPQPRIQSVETELDDITCRAQIDESDLFGFEGQPAGRRRRAIERREPSAREQLLAPEASREVWLRRVTFDLTGLPPSLAEQDAFLADETPDAFEKTVDRLLASPAYGERMASDWLDAARYGDTYGRHEDADCATWPYRDRKAAQLLGGHDERSGDAEIDASGCNAHR